MGYVAYTRFAEDAVRHGVADQSLNIGFVNSDGCGEIAPANTTFEGNSVTYLKLIYLLEAQVDVVLLRDLVFRLPVGSDRQY